MNKNQINIIRAIYEGKTSEQEIAEYLDLDFDTVNYHLENLDNSGYIKGAKGIPFGPPGRLEYKSCCLTSKGKVAATNPDDLIPETNVAENRTIYTNKYNEQSGTFGVGNMSGGEIKDSKVAGVINEAEQQNLTEITAQIQQMIEQLEGTYSTETITGRMQLATEVVTRVEKNPTLKDKIVRAVKAGMIAAIEKSLNHPVASFLAAAFREIK
ncbi:MAG: winged helix-turn-helix transcriptional regulator [Okeania sp. SIO2D1]|nr:winged helix-turn-helix transcriptional regulator [Okeania sp. SIO2D1]